MSYQEQVLNADYNVKWDVYPRHATSLYYAASFGLAEIVEALIGTGAELNAPGSRFGGTALHAAALREHIPVMKLLLEAGSDPGRADFNHVQWSQLLGRRLEPMGRARQAFSSGPRYKPIWLAPRPNIV